MNLTSRRISEKFNILQVEPGASERTGALGAANSDSQIEGRAESVPVLEVRGISKSFGTNVVLKDVSLGVSAGESVAVIGENGAGKSTLARILAGVIRPDAGDLRLEGRDVSFHSPRDALQLGIGFIPQELAYFPDLSIAENIRVGTWPSRLGVISHRKLARSALQAADQLGIQLDLRRAMSTLKVGERQLVEIVKALSRDAKLLILDEPTAALTDAESRNLLRVLAGLAGRGHGILYISHRMDEVFRFSDRVDVLRNGQLVASVSPTTTTRSFLIEQMLGEAARQLTTTATAARVDQAPALSLRDWHKAGEPGLRGVNIEVARGEVVGIFGLRGSGAELVAEGVGGLHRDIQGVTEVDGRRARRLSAPRHARKMSISYVPAERKRDGLVLSLPVAANFSLLVFSTLSRLGFLRKRLERDAARRWTELLRIRYRS